MSCFKSVFSKYCFIISWGFPVSHWIRSHPASTLGPMRNCNLWQTQLSLFVSSRSVWFVIAKLSGAPKTSVCKTEVENMVKATVPEKWKGEKSTIENAMLYLDLSKLGLAQARLLGALRSQSPSRNFLIP